MKQTPITLYDNSLTFFDTNKQDLLEMLTNTKQNVDLASL